MDGDDAAIICAVLDGDTERFAELVDRYQQPTLRLAFSLLGSAADAQDASQEAFVSAYRALGRFNSRSKFSTWLYRIVVNKCHDLARSRSRLPRTVSVVGPVDPDADGTYFVDIEDSASDARGRAVNQELARALSVAIEGLPMKQRSAFALHHLQGMALDEVAAVMHCRVGTVKSHVFRATEVLRVAMSPWRGEAQQT
jgi:RNA polymerase sigma-70 factor (ECF subfamily)